MNTQIAYRCRMARRKKVVLDDRVEFKAPPDWVKRATTEAERLGLNLSAFIRMVVTERLDRADAERRAQK